MAYNFWDAYYRREREGDSVDSGVSYFNYGGYEHEPNGDPDVTSATTGMASGSFSEFSRQPFEALPVQPQQTVCSDVIYIPSL